MRKSSERFGFNYLIFRHPTEYVLVLLPMVIASITDIYFQTSCIVEEFACKAGFVNSKLVFDVETRQSWVIDNYLFSVNIVLLILLGFFVSYRWSNMQFNGSYGFWITLGVNRTKYYINATIKFVLLFYFGVAIGLTQIMFLNNMLNDLFFFLTLNLLILSHIGLLVGIAVLLGNIVRSPEIASLLYVLIIGALLFINVNPFQQGSPSLIQGDGPEEVLAVFMSDFTFYSVNNFLFLAGAFGLGALINVIALRIHVTMDMEL